jgi:hypothetical protein
MPSTEFSITSVDPSLPKRLLGVEPAPATARQIHNAGIVLYRGSASTDSPVRHRHLFTVEFGTENAAGMLANWMWSALNGHVASLEIGGEPVPVQNAAIKRALLTSAAVE